MGLPPVFYHCFRLPLPYAQTLALQERLHEIQLLQRRTASHKDILLLLQHRPVFTAGRRQKEEDVKDERARLANIGADFVTTARGGQLTYHGPGQIVGYPLLDLNRLSPSMSIRDYICRIQQMLQYHLREAHDIRSAPSEHTGVFLNAQTKIASIGVQVRHRLTTHGFAVNITKEPLAWFDQIVACGLADVKAGCAADASGKPVEVANDLKNLVRAFGHVFERKMVKIVPEADEYIGEAIGTLELEAERAGDWRRTPLST